MAEGRFLPGLVSRRLLWLVWVAGEDTLALGEELVG